MAILKADGFKHYMYGEMAPLKTTLHEIMKDVEKAVKFAWPEVDCKIIQHVNKLGWEITLSTFSGGLIYYQTLFLSMQSIHEFEGKDFGVYFIK